MFLPPGPVGPGGVAGPGVGVGDDAGAGFIDGGGLAAAAAVLIVSRGLGEAEGIAPRLRCKMST